MGGLEPSDLNDDENTLRELCEKLVPVLGNLVESHDRIHAKDATLEPDTPLLDLIIASCPLDDDKGPCYVLMQHTVRE